MPFIHYLSIWLHFASLFATVPVEYCSNLLHGVSPLNITRKEGEQNIHIDCPFSTTSVPFWRINSSQYGPNSLPSSVHAYPTAYGITLTIVNAAMNETTFQCLVPSDSTGSHVLASEIGVLTVTESAGYDPPRLSGQILLNHQRLNFNNTHMTIAWVFEDNNCCSAPVTYSIWKTTCDTNNLTLVSTTAAPEYTILSSVADETVYFQISAKCTIECGRSSYFQVRSNVITGSASTTVNFPEGQESCINMAEVSTVLPSPTSPLYVVWPNNDGAGADCICPFCNDATTQCFLSNCYCYNTSLAPKLNVSSLSDSPSLCWPTSLNGTDIYFYAEDRSCSTVPNTRGPLLTRTYVYTARLFERGPPLKPTLSFNQTTSPPTICFDTYSFYVITSYEINITDVTNDTLVNRMTVNVSRGCIPLTPVLYPPQCSPYQVSVKAFNRVGASPVNVTKAELNPSSRRDYCSCLNEKLHISASIQDLTTTNVSLRVTCTKVLHSSQISAVVIGVVQNEEDQAKYPVRLYCNSSLETFKFMELQQNTHYNVTVISSNTSCVVTNFTTLLSRPPMPRIQYSNIPPQVCFNVCCDYDITYYEFTIFDVSRDILSQQLTTVTECVPMPTESFPSQCSPYDVLVKAYNRAGASDPATRESPTAYNGGDVCGCLEQKVDVSVTVTHITTTAATLNATCTKLLYSSHIESISILVRDQQYTVQCDGPHSPIRCSPLLRNTQYNVTTIIRFGAVDEKCPITNFTTPNSSIGFSSAATVTSIIISLSVFSLLK